MKIMNKMKTLMKKLGVGVLLLGLVGLVGSMVTQATVRANENEATETPAIVMQVSPVSRHFNLEPGVVQEGSITVSNIGRQGFNFRVLAVPFSMVDDRYEERSEEEGPRTEIVRWISFEQEEFYLEVNESVEVNFRIDVPSNAPGGGQFAMIVAETSDSDGEGTVAMTRRIGIPVYTRVSGETIERAELISTTIRRFYLSPPIMTSSTIENSGNVDVRAGYRLRVNSLFGRTVYRNYCVDGENSEACRIGRMNGVELHILPETRRIVDLEWEGAPALGVFRVTQEVDILGETYSETRLVIVVPLFLLVIMIVVILGAVVALVAKVKGRGSRNSLRKKKAKK